MTEKRTESFQQQAEQNIEAAALQVARSMQTPGQTKEQTKLIARGIAKGIALYKKQQNEKNREREKLRKKLIKQQTRDAKTSDASSSLRADTPAAVSRRAALWTAASVFTVLAAFHLWRFFTALPITVGNWPVPVWWSLPVAGVSCGMAVWLSAAGARDWRRASD